MDKEEVAKKIAERFDNLQPEIQDAIMSSDFEKNLYEISQKHKLSIEQMSGLELATSMVMLGDTHPDKYTDIMEEDLELPKEKVAEIVNDVNEKVLKPIREILKANFAREDEEETQSQVPIPPYAEKAKEIPPPTNLPVDTLEMSPRVNMQNEKNIMSEAGIEMVEENPIVEKENLLPNTETQKSVLKGIENPTAVPMNIINQKLQGPVTQSTVTSDHSIPKVNPPINTDTKTPHDPYHEAI